MQEEFEALGMPFDHRGSRADEQLEAFDALFTQPLASYDGSFYRFSELGFQPKPPNGHIPIWVGGNTEPAFRRAARYGDGFHAAFTTPKELAPQLERVRELCREQGRDPATLELSARVRLGPSELVNPEMDLLGEPERMLERIGEYAAIGVSMLLLDATARGGVEGRLDEVRRFMKDVAPRAS
jgi:alkanesulfonate monooxygenase SsuD/methylene tetrahydromethanopterin reductase-like flavin-dependent oxidoreductase (luciferase family)